MLELDSCLLYKVTTMSEFPSAQEHAQPEVVLNPGIPWFELRGRLGSKISAIVTLFVIDDEGKRLPMPERTIETAGRPNAPLTGDIATINGTLEGLLEAGKGHPARRVVIRTERGSQVTLPYDTPVAQYVDGQGVRGIVVEYYTFVDPGDQPAETTKPAR